MTVTKRGQKFKVKNWPGTYTVRTFLARSPWDKFSTLEEAAKYTNTDKPYISLTVEEIDDTFIVSQTELIEN